MKFYEYQNYRREMFGPSPMGINVWVMVHYPTPSSSYKLTNVVTRDYITLSRTNLLKEIEVTEIERLIWSLE